MSLRCLSILLLITLCLAYTAIGSEKPISQGAIDSKERNQKILKFIKLKRDLLAGPLLKKRHALDKFRETVKGIPEIEFVTRFRCKEENILFTNKKFKDTVLACSYLKQYGGLFILNDEGALVYEFHAKGPINRLFIVNPTGDKSNEILFEYLEPNSYKEGKHNKTVHILKYINEKIIPIFQYQSEKYTYGTKGRNPVAKSKTEFTMVTSPGKDKDKAEQIIRAKEEKIEYHVYNNVASTDIMSLVEEETIYVWNKDANQFETSKH